MEGYISSNNFNYYTIAKIHRAVHFAIGQSDWLSRKQLLEGLAFAGIPISYPQLYKDVELLKSCNISGFNHFKGDRGFDRSSSEIIVVFRWMATYRSRGQGVLHLPELLKLIRNYDNDKKQQRDHSTNQPIEVSSITV